LAGGGTPNQLRLAFRRRQVVPVFRGVHVASGHADEAGVRFRAALATQDPMAVLTAITAAVVHRLRWIPAEWRHPDAVVHVAVPRPDARRHRDGIRLHRRLIDPAEVAVVSGLRVFSVTRTLVEIARDVRVRPLLVVQILDGALTDGSTTHADLLCCLASLAGQRYVARARSLVLRARVGVDSPPETEMRLLLEDGGVEGLDVDIRIVDGDGFLLARGDLGVRRLLIWGEYDGYDGHSTREKFRGDRIGDRWLARRGWQVMRFVDHDLRRPGPTCRDWLQAMADAPARIAAMPASRSPEVATARRALGLDPPS
jgi:hypothetical protein